MTESLIVSSFMPGEEPVKSALYSVHPVECEDPLFDYWRGLNAVWDTDYTLINTEHDMEWSDDLVTELLSCPHDLCAYPYKVRPFGWPGGVWGASYGCLWVTDENPYASFSSIGFCKMTAAARKGSTLDQVVWDKLEASIHKAIVQRQRLWHIHWPAVTHYHDYAAEGGVDAETGSLYSVVKRARDEGRLYVYGDPMTDECLEGLKKHDPLIYDESLRRRAEALCID